MHQFPKFTTAWISTCFGQFLCPSSGVYSLYTRHWYMSYRFEDSFRAEPGWNCVTSCSCSTAVYKPVWHVTLLWINSWWWAEELSETCRFACRSKFGKLVHLVGFIIKKAAVEVPIFIEMFCYCLKSCNNIWCFAKHTCCLKVKWWIALVGGSWV